MHKTLFILVLILTFLSCDKNNDDSNNQEITRRVSLTLDGTAYEISDSNDGYIISGNTNCQEIYINIEIDNNDTFYELEFTLLKNGAIKRVSCLERPSYIWHLTPNFDVKSAIEITNFQYDETNNDVKFNFNGVLYKENEGNTNNIKEISGSFDLGSFRRIDCSVPFFQDISFSSNEFEFNTIQSRMTENLITLKQDHEFYSNNGYKLTIKTNDDLWNFPVGTYNFNENSIDNYIELKKYMGDIIATQTLDEFAEEWVDYQVNGSFTVDVKETVDSSKMITGTMNFEVLQGSEQLFQVSNLLYTTGSFD